MFEPVHGNATDIYEKIFRILLQPIWSCVMMLEHLGEKEAAAHLFACIEKITELNKITPDLRGSFTITQVGEVIIELL
jgi:tartrate dehydrogenase/decarboxylase/D-malate dehydrogenase